MSIKIWSLIIVSVKAPPTSIYRAKQSSVFKRMPCLAGSWHMVECGIFVITGQFCAGWCYYYFTSSRSQNRIMTCYEWPRNHCALGGGGGLFRAPPLISETTGPILKIQAAFESPGKTVEGKQILLISESRVTSQVKSKSKCLTFRAW